MFFHSFYSLKILVYAQTWCRMNLQFMSKQRAKEQVALGRLLMNFVCLCRCPWAGSNLHCSTDNRDVCGWFHRICTRQYHSRYYASGIAYFQENVFCVTWFIFDQDFQCCKTTAGQLHDLPRTLRNVKVEHCVTYYTGTYVPVIWII